MAQRILTSIAGLTIFFFIFFSNELVFSLAVLLVIAIALFEMLKAVSAKTGVWVMSYLSMAFIISGLLLDKMTLALSGTIIVYMIGSVMIFGKSSYKSIYSAAFITIYLSLFFGMMLMLYKDYGPYETLLLFIFSWITDTGAYFTGRFLGKHKLSPAISPKKTIEGAVGGTVLTVVITCIYLMILKRFFDVELLGGVGYLGISILAIIASVLSQFGDLSASAIKRICKVKDFGRLLPGHGGIMDRFDSVVFIAPVVYFFFQYFGA